MRDYTLLIVTLSVLAGCEWNSKHSRTDAGVLQPRPDRGMIDPDSDVDGDVTSTGHLLLTEVALQPGGAEFIEITNPTAADISLSDYYLADVGNYWRLPGGVPTINISDFIVEFPMADTIAAGSSITVATGTAAAFNTAYGSMPTYSITDSTITRTSVPGAPTLTDAGEIVVLFYWDGMTGLVSDVDIMVAGIPTAANGLQTKSGASVGSNTYQTDADTIPAQTSAPGSGKSTKRVLAELDHETQDGMGNGIGGDDETSEDTRATWDATFTAPTPGMAPTF